MKFKPWHGHTSCRLDRTRRGKYEERGEKGGASSRAKKTRKWDEGPRGKVKRMETFMTEDGDKIKWSMTGDKTIYRT